MEEGVLCTICNKKCKNDRGLKQHMTKSHQIPTRNLGSNGASRSRREESSRRDANRSAEKKSGWTAQQHRDFMNYIFHHSDDLDELCEYTKRDRKHVKRHIEGTIKRQETNDGKRAKNLIDEYIYEIAHPKPLSLREFDNVRTEPYLRSSAVDQDLRKKIAEFDVKPPMRKGGTKKQWKKISDMMKKADVFEKPEVMDENEWCRFEDSVNKYVNNAYDLVLQYIPEKTRKKNKDVMKAKLKKLKKELGKIKKERRQCKKALKIARKICKEMRAEFRRCKAKQRLLTAVGGRLKDLITTTRWNSAHKEDILTKIADLGKKLYKAKTRLVKKIRRLKKSIELRTNTRKFKQSRGTFYTKHGKKPTLVEKDLDAADLKNWHDNITKSDNEKEENLTDLAPDWLKHVLNESEARETIDWEIDATKVEYAITHATKDKAPGADGVGIALWKRTECVETLVKIFETCRVNSKIPASWKDGIAVALPKKSQIEVPKDYRLVILQRTIYKLFASVVANDMLVFAERNNMINSNQRAYRKGINGTMWNSFLVKEAIEDVRSNRSGKVILTLYDIANAFGSVEHDQLFIILEKFGFPKLVVELMVYIVDNTMFRIKMGEDLTEPVWQDKGVKQGDALSAFLFLFVLEPLARICAKDSIGYRMRLDYSIIINNQSFSDDLASLTNSECTTDRFVHYFITYLEWLKMKAHPQKSKTFALKFYQHNPTLFDPEIYLGEDKIEQYKSNDLELAEYLGITIDNTFNDNANFKKMEAELMRRLTAVSMFNIDRRLIPQCVREFVIPVLQYGMRLITIKKRDLREIDRKIGMVVKQKLGLDISTSTAFLRCEKYGGIGLPSCLDMYYKFKLSFALELLNNKDDTIRKVAWYSLGNAFNNQNREYRINNNIRIGYQYDLQIQKSFWKQVQKAAVRYKLNLVIDIDEDGNEEVKLITLEEKYVSIKKYAKEFLQQEYLDEWRKLEMQGRYVRLLPKDVIDHKMKCNFTTWNVITKGRASRLNVLALQKIENRSKHDRCSCGQRQTQEHILSHCPKLMRIIRCRHDNALRTLKPFIQKTLTTDDQLIWDIHTPRHLYKSNQRIKHDRPDVIIVNHVERTIRVLEFTVCYDSRYEAAVSHKYNKYVELLKAMEANNFKTEIHVLAIGTLGTVTKSAIEALDKFVIPKQKLACLDKLVSSVITGTTMVWQNRTNIL